MLEPLAQAEQAGNSAKPIPKRKLGKTGEELSIIGFAGIVVMENSPSFASNIVAEAVDRGINYFDVAPTYGDAQERLGSALEPYRNKVFLACKQEDWTQGRFCKASGRNLCGYSAPTTWISTNFTRCRRCQTLNRSSVPTAQWRPMRLPRRRASCVSSVSQPTRWKWLFPQWIAITSTRFCSRLTLSFTPRPILDRKCSRRPGRRKWASWP